MTAVCMRCKAMINAPGVHWPSILPDQQAQHELGQLRALVAVHMSQEHADIAGEIMQAMAAAGQLVAMQYAAVPELDPAADSVADPTGRLHG